MGQGSEQDRQRYPTDLTDGQWAVIEPLLPPPSTGGRPEKHPRRGDRERDFVCVAYRVCVADAATRLSAVADGLLVFQAVARRGCGRRNPQSSA